MSERLFLLDARHPVERRLLLDHLERSETGARRIIDLPASRGSVAGLQTLAQALDGDETTEVVPLRVAWRIPHFSRDRPLRLRDFALGDPRQPGPWRARLIVRRDPTRAQCLRGAGATLGELRQRYRAQVAVEPDGHGFSGFVARQAALALDVEERGVQGSRYKVPRFVSDTLVSHPEFRAEIDALAGPLGRDPGALLAEARECLREMVSEPSAHFLDLRQGFDRWLWLRDYEPRLRFDRAEFDRLRQIVRRYPTVLLFTHKTYGDAALPGLLLHANDLPMLHTFGGANLDLPGFGALMRRSGGIFIRRSFHDDPLYKLVLRRYVAFLLEKRFPMSWALEGTRSRLGKLMPPRLGLLKYTIDAAREARLENLHVVPFVTSFESIRDVDEYVAEQAGRPKKPESLLWLLRYARGVRRPLGRVRIDLGEPVVVTRPPAADDALGLAKIAFEAAVHANRATPLTVTGVMCLVLLGMTPRRATAPELVKFVQVLAEWARARDIRLSDELAADDPDAFLHKLDALADSGQLSREGRGAAASYGVGAGGHPVASYYRNTIVHHFLHKAFIELAVQQALASESAPREDAFWTAIERLRDLFKFEFFYPSREQFRSEVRAELDRVDPHHRAHLAGSADQVRRLAGRLQPFIAQAALLPYAEAYGVVLGVLAGQADGQAMDEAECVARALQEGRAALLAGRLSSEASIGKILFQNGYRLAANLGLAGRTDARVSVARDALRRELQSLVHGMERLRLEALACVEDVMARQAQA